MSFWTKPIGQTLAERKGKPYYKPMFFGTTKLGYIELKSDGRITYQARLDNRTDKTKFDAADITAVSIETAEDYVARVSGGRVARSEERRVGTEVGAECVVAHGQESGSQTAG